MLINIFNQQKYYVCPNIIIFVYFPLINKVFLHGRDMPSQKMWVVMCYAWCAQSGGLCTMVGCAQSLAVRTLWWPSALPLCGATDNTRPAHARTPRKWSTLLWHVFTLLPAESAPRLRTPITGDRKILINRIQPKFVYLYIRQFDIFVCISHQEIH